MKRRREDSTPFLTLLQWPGNASCVIKQHHPAKTATTKRKPRRKSNCIANPRCLYGLGEGVEGVWAIKPEKEDEDGTQNFSSITQFGLEDTRPRLRLPNRELPVGLSNLGATCYLNSQLQLLYHNILLREEVFRWAGEGTSPEIEAMREVQSIFAHLQASTLKYLDTKPLGKLLEIDSFTQQDPHEFNSLFMVMLEHWMKKEGLNVVAQVFKGHLQYLTQCIGCQAVSTRDSEFMDLQLQIEGKDSVLQCLKGYLSTELLTDENKYLCGACNSKNDATRVIKLTEFPEVLSLQLLRYAVDPISYQRRKLRTSIRIQRTLNFSDLQEGEGQEVQQQSGDDDGAEDVYELVGMLCHKGDSAQVGHYVAEVYDWERDRWHQFDDTIVSQLPPQGRLEAKFANAAAAANNANNDGGVQVKGTTVDKQGKETVSSNAKSKAVGKGKKAAAKKRSGAAQGDVSRDAYSLMYARRSILEQYTKKEGSKPYHVILPEKVAEVVRATDARAKVEREQFDKSLAELVAAAEERERAYISVFGNPDPEAAQPAVAGADAGANTGAGAGTATSSKAVPSPAVTAAALLSGDYYWIATDWLKKWITGLSSASTNSSNNTNNSNSTSSVGTAKEGSSDMSICMKTDSDSATQATSKAIFNLPIENSPLLCPHKTGLSPDIVLSGAVKVISAKAYKALEALAGGADRELYGRNDDDFACPLCTEAAKNTLDETARTQCRVTEVLAVLSLPEPKLEPAGTAKRAYALSRKWVTKLKGFAKKLEAQAKSGPGAAAAGKRKKRAEVNASSNVAVAGINQGEINTSAALEDDLDHTVNSLITCCHGGLVLSIQSYRLISEEGWAVIATQFPQAIAHCIKAEQIKGCANCVQDKSVSDLAKEQNKQTMASEFRGSASLIALYKRHAPIPKELALTLQGDAQFFGVYYFVDGNWLAQWRLWHQERGRVERPGCMKLPNMTCSHNKLMMEPDLAKIMMDGECDSPIALEASSGYGLVEAHQVEVVTAAEWADLAAYRQGEVFSSAPIPSVTISASGKVYSPEECIACANEQQEMLEKKRTCFSQGVVKVVKLMTSETVPSGKELGDANAAEARHPSGRRARSRTRSRQTYDITCSSNDTLSKFQLLICQSPAQAAPLVQKLFYDGKPLGNEAANRKLKLSDLGIKNGHVVYMRVEERDGKLDDDSFPYDASAYDDDKPAEGRSFSGLLLGGMRISHGNDFNSAIDVDDRHEQEGVIEASQEGVALQCTNCLQANILVEDVGEQPCGFCGQVLIT